MTSISKTPDTFRFFLYFEAPNQAQPPTPLQGQMTLVVPLPSEFALCLLTSRLDPPFRLALHVPVMYKRAKAGNTQAHLSRTNPPRKWD